jgi:hypothetical protein
MMHPGLEWTEASLVPEVLNEPTQFSGWSRWKREMGLRGAAGSLKITPD